MYKRILLAFDGSEAGRRALLECTDIENLLHAELHLLAVAPPQATLYTPGAVAYDTPHGDGEGEFAQILRDGLRLLDERSANARGHLAFGVPEDEICRFAADLKCDLIVVGHQRRGSWILRHWKASIGSVLIESAPCSVLVAISD